MDLLQMCDRLIANGQNMSLNKDSARTNDGFNSLEVFFEIEKTGELWIISKTSYNTKAVTNSYLTENEACWSYFLQRFKSLTMNQNINNYWLKYLNYTIPQTKADLIVLLKELEYPSHYYSFKMVKNLKCYFFIDGDIKDNSSVFYCGMNKSIKLFDKGFFRADSFFALPMIRKEEQILLENGIINEPFSDEDIVAFLKL
jgi:hypothetical protein